MKRAAALILALFLACTSSTNKNEVDQKAASEKRDAPLTDSLTVTANAPVAQVAKEAGVAGGVVGGSPAPPPPATWGRANYKIAADYDAAFSRPQYAAIQEHRYTRTADEKTTTFSIDVDGASYTNVRRHLNANLVPPPDAVRIEEMINYFDYNYPQPSGNVPFSATTEVAGCPWEPTHRIVRIGIAGKSLESWKLAPNNLVFLLDVSGSMQPPERLPLIKSAMRVLVEQLRPNDSVAIVVYAGAAGLVLPPTSDKTAILAALDRLNAGGSTAGGAGIELAYKTALDNYSRSSNNRVILATDGDFNVGITDRDTLTKLIEEKRKSGVYLTAVGVGDNNYNDALMESLADKGNGNYYYLDGLQEAKRIFSTQLQGTMVTVANDVKVQLEFDPSAVEEYRQIGYENRALANEDFADDTKDAGELGSGHTVTALYEIKPKRTGRLGELRLRYKNPLQSTSQLVTATIVDDGKSAYAASPDMQFAIAVAEFGMLLRDSEHKGTSSYADVLALARAMRGTDAEGFREEFSRMVETARTLKGESPISVGGQ
jgi:Ca-activated chloride channel family protein